MISTAKPKPGALQDDPLIGNIKVTRQNWLDLALDVLISDGVEQVKVLSLSRKLGVSRSSFYWYFKSRKELLDELLAIWSRTNTAAIIERAKRPSRSITQAVLNVFECFVDTDLFSPQLDFAIREWSRRSGAVRRVVDLSDEARVKAVCEMFERHGYPADEAFVRARVLYYMQIGYYALELHEPLEQRLSYLHGYLLSFTGERASEEEVQTLVTFARSHAKHDR